MSIINYNLALLAKNQDQHVIAEITESDRIYEYAGRDDVGEWFFDTLNQKMYLLKNELDRENLPNPLKRELYFIVGIYAVEEIEQLLNSANPNSFFIVYEPNLAFLEAAINLKQLDILQKKHIILIAHPLKGFMTILNRLLSMQIMLLAGNFRFYMTYFYRNYGIKQVRQILDVVTLVLKTLRWGMGNSIHDCLEGSTQNLQNIKHILQSKDVRKLKDKFTGIPAIIVSAGPSLEKNIQYLHQAKGKAVIISTESILSRLLKENIIPDFVASIERIQEAYDYSYKDKNIPPEVTLIGPPVLKPRIFAEYKGDFIIAMREGITEFTWLARILGLNEDAFIMMGDSTAHVGVGFALHTGCNPIILVGQDLAFGEMGTKCHASGTIYEEIGTNPYKDPMQEPTIEVEGYNGGKVVTSELWVGFKKWFEMYIQVYEGQRLFINSTEGGAKINGALQLPLAKVIEQYCQQNVEVNKMINECPLYDLNMDDIIKKLKEEDQKIKKINKLAVALQKQIKKLKVHENDTPSQLASILKSLKNTDKLLSAIYAHPLVFHDIQPEIVNTFHKLYKLEEVLKPETVKANINIQLYFLDAVIYVSKQLLHCLKEVIPELENLQSEGKINLETEI